MAKNAAILLFCLLSLTACGGRSPADLQRTLGYIQQMDAQGRPVMDLASQNRLSMQRNTPFSYIYTSPNSDEETETASSTTVNTDDLLPSDASATAQAEATEESMSDLAVDVEAEAAPKATLKTNLPQAKAFSLENLQGTTQQFSFPRTKILILAIADQKGSEDMENWIKPLYDRYSDSVDIHGVAELSAVPKLARGIARGIISGIVKQPIMLDWTGSVSQQFGAKSGVTNVYAINAQGQIIASGSGLANLDKLKAIAESVDNAL
jgi:hypothetical protein